MSDIVHILRGFNGDKGDILAVKDCDLLIKEVQTLFVNDYERFETEAWMVGGDEIFSSFQIIKRERYSSGMRVLWLDDDKMRRLSYVTYCDGREGAGVQNMMYRVEVAAAMGICDYILGADIIGEVVRKDFTSPDSETTI